MAPQNRKLAEELDWRTIWEIKDLSSDTKVLVYNSIVIGILIYNSETWTLTERLSSRLQTFETGCFMKVIGVSRLSHQKHRQKEPAQQHFDCHSPWG